MVHFIGILVLRPTSDVVVMFCWDEWKDLKKAPKVKRCGSKYIFLLQDGSVFGEKRWLSRLWSKWARGHAHFICDSRLHINWLPNRATFVRTCLQQSCWATSGLPSCQVGGESAGKWQSYEPRKTTPFSTSNPRWRRWHVTLATTLHSKSVPLKCEISKFKTLKVTRISNLDAF